MGIPRRAWFLIVVSAIYLAVAFYVAFVHRHDGILLIAQFLYAFICSVPIWCRRVARWLHMPRR